MPLGNGKMRNGSSAKESPWDHASILSKYFLSFMVPIFRKAYGGQLNVEDIGAPPRVDYSRTLGLRVTHNYNQELLNRKNPSFLRSLIKTFGCELFLFSISDFISKCVAFPMQTIALGWLIKDAGLYLNAPGMAAVSAVNDAMANNTVPQPVVAGGAAAANAIPPFLPQLPPVLAAAAEDLTGETAFWNIIYDSLYLIIFTWVAIVLAHPMYFQTYHIGMKCRIAACYMIYKKSLRLSQSAMTETTVGQMVNLLSNDVNRFDQVINMMPYLLIGPAQAIVCVVILSVFYLGAYPTLASLVSMIIYVIIQTSMGRGFGKFRAKTAQRTDERVRLMNEIILAMRIIKMYAWEKPFKSLVRTARRREVTTIGVSLLLKVINGTLFFVSSKIIVFAALITYVLLGYSFNPEIVFVSIGLANLMRISLTLMFPGAVAYCAETVVSCRRIDKFLKLPELEHSLTTYKASNDCFGCKYVVQMSKVTASWTPYGRQDDIGSASKLSSSTSTQIPGAGSDSKSNEIIRNLSLGIKPRDLVLIVGRVGSGKSSVLMSILGELPVTSGCLQVNGRISYASQEAWIFSGSVRDNILFGKSMDPERYSEVIRVCSLNRDLDLLVDGDLTIVGERGVSLSGGQKARVNLARALYNEADLYLLDDPLSAVDAPVAKHIFNESLRTFLRKKTVILATHQLQFLRHASKVLVVDRDSPAAFGTLQEVMDSEAFAVVDYSKEAFEDATSREDVQSEEGSQGGGEAQVQRHSRKSSRSTTVMMSSSSASTSKAGSLTPPKSREGSSGEDNTIATAAAKQVAAEEAARQVGVPLIRPDSQASSNLNESVKLITSLTNGSKGGKNSGEQSDYDDAPAEQKAMRRKQTGGSGSDKRQGTEILSAISSDCSTYRYYISNAFGFIMLTWFILTNVAAQGLYQYTDYFLSFWTDSVQRKEYQGANFVPVTFVDSLTSGDISIIYAALVGLCIVSTFFRTSTLFFGTLRASINIHNKLFNSVIHAPMSFFDFSPIGILLNRLSRDIGFVDETLPQTLNDIIVIFVNIIGIIVLTIVIDYKNSGAAVVLLILVFALRHFSARAITRLKQIEGLTRSPVFSHLSTTLSGLPTIRAFKVQDEFVRIFDRHQDTHTSAWFNYIAAGRWLAVTMDWLCLLFIVSVVILLLIFSLDSTNASLIGLLISQVVIIPGPLQWGMRQLIEMESQMTSVQRIKEFSELKPEEEVLALRRDDNSSSASSSSLHEHFTIASYQSGLIPPARGEIRFIDVTLSYFPDEPPVIKNLNFTIKPREKIGIVGRTGAGKSSIVSILFRLYDFSGSIEIDGRDSKSMSLAQLRRSMSIIPQDPILFGGTIRRNLDPFSEYSDAALWDALEAVQLRQVFSRYAQGLDFQVSEAGSNFSVGQRQLICLARAIVRRNQILVLDEATANVDPETDAFIQRTIATQFSHCTVLTIAHRLITIVDSDRVLVLDRGEVREFASPYELINDESSLFAQMINSSARQAARLKDMIREKQLARESESS